MEKLEDPRKLKYTFQPAPNSALENFFNNADASPRTARSQNGPSSSQPASQNGGGSIEEFSEKFDQALQSFGERGNSAEFQKQVDEIIESSMKFHPEMRAFVKALELSLDEFVEEEDKGGLPKESLKTVVDEVKGALDAGMQVLTDRKILQELRASLSQLPKVNQGKSSAHRRKFLESRGKEDEDPDEEDADVEEDEDDADVAAEEDDEGPSTSALRAHAGIYKDAKSLDQKRRVVMSTLGAEREANEKTLKKIMDKIRDKRGYEWSIKNGKLVEVKGNDSMVIRTAVTQKIIADPITRGKITDPVRSSKCGGNHVYQRETLLEMVKQARKRDAKGMRCSYLGCPQYILPDDVVEDEDYARFLARSAVGTEANEETGADST